MIDSWNPQRLHEAMVICGLSNQELGDKLGVTWKTVARWKNDFNKGRHQPTLKQLWEISKITGFPYKYFVTEDTYEVKSRGIFY